MALTDDDVREILRIIDESELDELRIETDGFTLHVRKDGAPAPEAATPTGGGTIDAPMLGTFYRAPAPGEAPFVDVGTVVEPDTVVGGEVTPDAYLISKVTGDVRTTVGDKHIEYRGSEARSVDEERRQQPCLDDGQIDALLDLAKRVQAHFGSHQDVEWAFAGDELFVLQSRPVTVKREAPQGGSAAPSPHARR